MKKTGCLAAALTLWLTGTTLAQAGALYKWVGEDGSVHYSAQSPVMNKSETLQRVHIHTTKGAKELLAPDFDSSRNIVAEEAHTMMTQDDTASGAVHLSADTLPKKPHVYITEPGVTDLQASATHSADQGLTPAQ